MVCIEVHAAGPWVVNAEDAMGGARAKGVRRLMRGMPAAWALAAALAGGSGVASAAAEPGGSAQRAGRAGPGPPRLFRTASFVLFHAASCRVRYSSWASCGVR